MRYMWSTSSRLVSYKTHLRLRKAPVFHTRRPKLALPLILDDAREERLGSIYSNSSRRAE